MRTAAVTTLGCKVNQLESAAIATALEEAGITLVSDSEEAGIIIINTCAVTAAASRQSRQKLRRLLRTSPQADVYITGCHAEEAHAELATLPELAGRHFSLYGNDRKDLLMAQAIAGTHTSDVGHVSSAREITRLPLALFARRTRAFLRIQDGCNAFCSYCIVPSTRGRSRSLPADEVVAQARLFAESGHLEVVLTGIHLGLYGIELSPPDSLVRLVDRLTAELPQLRFRISSLEPMEISDALLELIGERDNLMPHLHIPLQSGCDRILRAMNRRYTTRQFREVVESACQRIPDLAVGIDILAGFPGESSAEFDESCTFLDRLPFSYLHVFPYSRRPGTPAAALPGQIEKSEKERRAKLLRELSVRRKEAFYHSQIGSVRPVIFEGRRDRRGRLKGFTDNYLDVRCAGDDTLLRRAAQVQLTGCSDGTLSGEIVRRGES